MRHAICNEIYGRTDFAEACRSMRMIGYQGIEIAPFTLAEDPARIPVARRREIGDILRSEGLEFVGLHWLLVAPEGLHVTTPDAALRERSWRHVRDLVDLCADLGSGGVMVFGSPKQRSTTGGATVGEATERFLDGVAGVAPHAETRGVTILVEALPAGQSNVITSLAEAATMALRVGSAAVATMFDTHNAVDEREPHGALVERYFDWIRHVHVNEMDGRHPGTGGYDFAPVLAALEQKNYRGWVSLEVFDFTPGAEIIARESLAHLEAVRARAAA